MQSYVFLPILIMLESKVPFILVIHHCKKCTVRCIMYLFNINLSCIPRSSLSQVVTFLQVFLPKLFAFLIYTMFTTCRAHPWGLIWSDNATNLRWTHYNVWSILGAFTKLWKATVSFIMSVSACQYATTQLPLDRFSWNVTFQYFSKIQKENSIFIKIWWE